MDNGIVISEIVNLLSGNGYKVKAEGNLSSSINGFSSLSNYKNGTITWVRNENYLIAANITENQQFSCIVTPNCLQSIPNAVCQLKTDDPKAVFFFILDHYWKEDTIETLSEKAFIEEGAKIGPGTSVGPFSHISSKAVIGKNCHIGSNVVIKGKVRIGDNCVIQSGAILGECGYQYIEEKGKLIPVPHYGGVTLGNNVLIGSCTCVCRGTIDDTIIGDYSKIDNLCHIAHNIVIGKRVRVIAGSTIMGSVHIGDDSWVATSMIRDQRKVGSRSVVGMGAVVVKDVRDNVTVAGIPAKEIIRNEKI